MKVSRELQLLRASLNQIFGNSGLREAIYQSANAVSGLTVTFDVYKPDLSKDEVQSGTAIEIGDTGRYYLHFISDGPGWFVTIHDSADGKQVKHF